MNLLLKRLLLQFKIPLVIFTIIFGALWVLMLLEGHHNILVETVNLMISSSIIAAFVAGFLKYSSLLSRRREKDRLQGAGKRVIKFFEPLIADIIFFIIIDLIVIALYFGFNIQQIMETEGVYISFTLVNLDSYTILFVKYVIISSLFFIFAVSKNFIEVAILLILSYVSLAQFYYLFFNAGILPLVFVGLFILASYFIYRLKYFNHKTTLLRYLCWMSIGSLFVVIAFDAIITLKYANTTELFSIAVGDYRIGIIPLFILLAMCLGFEIRANQRLGFFKAILILFIMPLVFGAAITSGSTYMQERAELNDLMSSSYSSSAVGLSRWGYYDENGALISKQTVPNIVEIQEEIKAKLVRKLNLRDLDLVDQQILNKYNLTTICSFDKEKGQRFSGLILKDDLQAILERNGYKTVQIIDITSNEENSLSRLIISLPEYKELIMEVKILDNSGTTVSSSDSEEESVSYNKRTIFSSSLSGLTYDIVKTDIIFDKELFEKALASRINTNDITFNVNGYNLSLMTIFIKDGQIKNDSINEYSVITKEQKESLVKKGE